MRPGLNLTPGWYDFIEVSGVVTVEKDDNGRELVEAIIDNPTIKPEFYSIYVHYSHESFSEHKCGGVDCIADFNTRADALVIADALAKAWGIEVNDCTPEAAPNYDPTKVKP